MSGEVKDILLLDVTPLSLGVETLGGVMTKIISRNTTIPTKKFEFFSTAQDNQTSVQIHVLQGEREFATDNKSLGEFKLDGIPSAPRNVPKIEVNFDIDVNGILTVKAKDNNTGVETSIIIEGSSKLADSDIDKMIEEAEKFANEDKQRKENIQLKNEADSLIYETTKKLETNPNLDPNVSEEIQTLIKTINQNIENNTFEELALNIERLTKKVQALENNIPNEDGVIDIEN